MQKCHLPEIRCGRCTRKLGAGRYLELSIKCPRCKAVNVLKAESLQSERPRAPDSEKPHGNQQIAPGASVRA
ncbi:Com family DNA-binding transcriptional regulator [Burkholderia sp. Ac-20345]|uniref:Com family DNA-binding transcriptional regulator n=1 Tax=Burkholderia sp. Ac-20345 TaxID=2703891 RepID=UPI00197C2C41|nr:Com family DNA-binding transcriptional regulator [Burkholderia sp. Ac-20345]MBN3779905.1 Com family DNA-binding transcriptional regulator [Burkholderia sp. Ac-20345]